MPRYVTFNIVGIIGFAVQLGALAVGLHCGVHYVPATAAAVEAAVLHNFLWHERWTWRDRPAYGRERLNRLGRFHLVNGLVSLAGNVALVWALVSGPGLHPVAANAIAVIGLSIVNYLWGDLVVFRDAARAER